MFKHAARAALLVFLTLALSASPALAVREQSGAYETYNYSYRDNGEIKSAAAYVPVRVVRAEDMGIAGFKTLSDLYIDESRGDVWLCDTDNHRVVRADLDFTTAAVFAEAGGAPFSSPRGVCVADGNVYIADTGNRRVVKMSREGETLAVFGRPDSPQFASGVDFKPQKVVVTRQGEISIVCEGVYEGLVTLDAQGQFQGYSGTIPVRPSLWDLFWRLISTREQLKSMSSFLPVTYINVDLDGDGFIYATSQAEQSTMANSVQRLNPGGNDVLINNSGQRLVGDLGNLYAGRAVGASVLGDICCMRGGLFACVDQRRGKIFLYDGDGEMLFAFGGLGSQDGHVTVPSAIDSVGETLYVADSSRGQITVYEPTAYGRCLMDGILFYNDSRYEESRDSFMEAFRYNTNSELAYLGIGKSQMRQGEYHDAMLSFRLAANRGYYSRALEQYRREVFDAHFTEIFVVIACALFVIVCLPIAKKMYRKKHGARVRKAPAEPSGRVLKSLDRLLESVDFAFYCALHPYKGFYELKAEKRGTVSAATVLLALYLITALLGATLSGFLYSGGEQSPLVTLGAVLFPIALFVVANWCITTLMEGEGRMADIYRAVCYSLTPMILGQVLLLVLSNVLTLEESSVYAVIQYGLWIYTAYLLLAGNMQAHGFTMGRTAAAALVTLLAMAVMVFLMYLFFNLLFEVAGFGAQIYQEIVFRV